jgi:hypothetical protein
MYTSKFLILRSAGFYYLSLLLVALNINCACNRKEATRSITVSIGEQSTASPDYTVIYTFDNAGGQKNVTADAEQWSSEQIELEPGQFMKVVVSSTGPEYDLQIIVRIDGGIWKEGQLRNPEGTLELSGAIPSI